jgi:hypothetical protein
MKQTLLQAIAFAVVVFLTDKMPSHVACQFTSSEAEGSRARGTTTTASTSTAEKA